MTTLQMPGINVLMQRRQTTAGRLRQEGEGAIHAAGAGYLAAWPILAMDQEDG